jgi:hypothetical protein
LRKTEWRKRRDWAKLSKAAEKQSRYPIESTTSTQIRIRPADCLVINEHARKQEMKTLSISNLSGKLAKSVMVLFAIAASTGAAFAADPASPRLTSDPIEPGIYATSPALPEAPKPHRFWDKQNTMLFAGVAAVNTADFVVTRQNLLSGGKELNPVTRVFAGNSASLALNFAGETAATMGIAYMFHRTGHYRLERMTSLVAISYSAPAVIYSGTHR